MSGPDRESEKLSQPAVVCAFCWGKEIESNLKGP